MTAKQFYQWRNELDETVKSLNIERFKTFYRKWSARGVYSGKLPPDDVIEISMRKIICNIVTMPKDLRQEAAKWLFEHGSTPEM